MFNREQNYGNYLHLVFYPCHCPIRWLIFFAWRLLLYAMSGTMCKHSQYLSVGLHCRVQTSLTGILILTYSCLHADLMLLILGCKPDLDQGHTLKISCVLLHYQGRLVILVSKSILTISKRV